MKRLLSLLLLAALVVSAEAKPAQRAKSAELRVGTYNVWSHSARKWQIERKKRAPQSRSWDVAKGAVAELIVKTKCDILGLQEVTSVCRDDIKALLRKCGGKHYKMLWLNSYPEGHKNVVGNAILYNKRMLKVEAPRLVWLSPTPEKHSTGWDEKRHYRTALLTKVTHKRSGRQIFFIATHGPLKREANNNSAYVLVDTERKYNTEGLPAIVVGDMNANPAHPFYTVMCSHFDDALVVAERSCGTVGTFNSSTEREKNFTLPNRRIDHIYLRSTDKGRCRVLDYTVNRDKLPMGGTQHYPSDHNPVHIDLVIE